MALRGVVCGHVINVDGKRLERQTPCLGGYAGTAVASRDPALTAIAACMRQCASAKDGRGRWRAERDLVRTLAVPGASVAVAQACAAAARRVGEGMARWGRQP